jgi:hypothetical protein
MSSIIQNFIQVALSKVPLKISKINTGPIKFPILNFYKNRNFGKKSKQMSNPLKSEKIISNFAPNPSSTPSKPQKTCPKTSHYIK